MFNSALLRQLMHQHPVLGRKATRAEVAQATGLSMGTLQRLLQNAIESGVRLETLKRLSCYFGVPAARFLDSPVPKPVPVVREDEDIPRSPADTCTRENSRRVVGPSTLFFQVQGGSSLSLQTPWGTASVAAHYWPGLVGARVDQARGGFMFSHSTASSTLSVPAREHGLRFGRYLTYGLEDHRWAIPALELAWLREVLFAGADSKHLVSDAETYLIDLLSENHPDYLRQRDITLDDEAVLRWERRQRVVRSLSFKVARPMPVAG